MSPPPLLVGAALLFWGWETDLLLPALFVAVVLESARVLRWRLEFSASDFDRVADLCALLLAGSAVWVFGTAAAAREGGGPRALALLFQRLPMLFALLVACQVYSTAGRVPLSAFFWALRRRARREGVASPEVDLAYPFVVLCVLAASAANARTPAFYLGLCALAAWALWPLRSPRVSRGGWAALLVAVAALGWGGQAVLHEGQAQLERLVFDYLFNLVKRRDADPFRSSTALGHLGELKLSDRIVLRVDPAPGVRMPLLLRDASYNVYNATVWFAVGAAFTRIHAEADGQTWRFRGARARAPSVGVSAYLPRGRGMLVLPNGAFEIDRLAAAGVSRNPLGAVRVDEGLGLVSYRARFGAESVLDGPPGGEDLSVPSREAPALRRLAAELDLARKPPAERVEAVAEFFHAGFRYTTYQRAGPVGDSPFEDFLLRTRAGHCEYFATATVLLLRAAGVPARYATGYSVQEWSALERTWVARGRHAHSWTLAWVDGAWRDLDTTPAVWASEDGAHHALAPIADLWALAEYLFFRWRYGEGVGDVTALLGWLLVPLGLLLAWRLYGRRRRRVEARPALLAPPRPRQGADSDFYRIESELAREGLGRRPAEAASAWVRRLREAGAPPATESLPAILALHYRYRFDPEGLDAEGRAALRAGVERWLAERTAAARGD